MKESYHLGLTESDVAEVELVLLPGDPARVERLAQAFAPTSREIAFQREFRSWKAELKGKQILITSTGIGGASTSIAVEELAQLGLKKFVRVGTSGSLQKEVEIGAVVITTGAVRLDSTSQDYAPIEYPAVADYEFIIALKEAAEAVGVPSYVGITASASSFYAGEEREDGYFKWSLRRVKGLTQELAHLNVLNIEMEAATLLTLSSVFGLRAGCITGIVDTRSNPRIDPKVVKEVEEKLIKVILNASPKIIGG